MGSEFEEMYRQTAADRQRYEVVPESAEAKEARIQRARDLAGPAIADFAGPAAKILRNEEVWCEKGRWPIPMPGARVAYRLDKVQSGFFRKRWLMLHHAGAFVLTTTGQLGLQFSHGSHRSDEGALFAKMAVGGAEAFKELQSQYLAERVQTRLWFDTDANQLLFLPTSDPTNTMPFIEYGARAVDALVTAWRNRKY